MRHKNEKGKCEYSFSIVYETFLAGPTFGTFCFIRTMLICGQSGKVKHSFSDLLRQQVFGLVADHEDLNNHHELRNDPLIQTLVGRDRQLAIPSSLCRFENG